MSDTSKEQPIKGKEEFAKDIYLRITSYAPYSEMNGITRQWFEKCIAEGLEEYKNKFIHGGSINRWVKASERLPDKCDEYPKGVVFRKDGYSTTVKSFAQYDYYSGEGWEWLDDTPIQSGEERLFTLKEAFDIWDSGSQFGLDPFDTATKQQYFSEKFGILLSSEQNVHQSTIKRNPYEKME